MASISLPFTLTAGAAENVNQLNSNLSTITSLVNGNIDGANAPFLVSHYRTVVRASAQLAGGTANGTYMVNNQGGFQGDGTAGFPYMFYLDPADYAVTGLTTRYRLRVSLGTNATAPGTSFTYGLHTVTATAGAGGFFTTIASTAVASSTVTRTTPSASTRYTDTSADFSAPAAGALVFGLIFPSGTAANSACNIEYALQVRNT